jgi:hypothetical protein
VYSSLGGCTNRSRTFNLIWFEIGGASKVAQPGNASIRLLFSGNKKKAVATH